VMAGLGRIIYHAPACPSQQIWSSPGMLIDADINHLVAIISDNPAWI